MGIDRKKKQFGEMSGVDEPCTQLQPVSSVTQLSKVIKRKIRILLAEHDHTIMIDLSCTVSPLTSHRIPYFLCTPRACKSPQDYQCIDSTSNFRTY